MALEVNISGRVQGVSFRWEAQRQAERLGVTGWVRNEPDGSVAGHFEGDRAGELVDWCRQGPAYARVDRVRVDEVPDSGDDGVPDHVLDLHLRSGLLALAGHRRDAGTSDPS